MSCSHMAADDFEIEDFPCNHCGYMGYVEFRTCSCMSGAAGECQNCNGELWIGPHRDDLEEVWVA